MDTPTKFVIPRFEILVPRFRMKGRVCAVLRCAESGEINDVFETDNLVTTAGDQYYGDRGVALTPPSNFTNTAGTFDAIMELYDATTSGAVAKGNDRSDLGTLITGSDQAMDTGYPKVNDLDTANTGKGAQVMTYKVSYATGDANGTDIDDVIITNPSPGATEAMLMHADGLGAFTKTTSDTLVIYVNHTPLGA